MLLPLRKLPCLAGLIALLVSPGCMTHDKVHYNYKPKPLRISEPNLVVQPKPGSTAAGPAATEPTMTDSAIPPGM